jgi:outer membrane lipoprotein-sorting protein
VNKPIAATLALFVSVALSVAHAQDAAPAPPAVDAAPAKPAKPAKGKAKARPAEDGAESAAADPNAPRNILPKPPKEITREEAIRRANAFFNASPVMTADFVQIGADGKRSEGKLHVQRAGRVRFEYAQPATMEFVSDGAQVLVRDRKLNTQDLYLITQTPLKFLLKERIDLEKDVTLDDVIFEDTGVTVAVTDKSTFGGTSHLKLIFDRRNFKLKQWQITDPQGYETLISLFNVDQTKIPDPSLFKINK